MPRLPRVTSKRLVRALQSGGFNVIRQTGSHVVLRDEHRHTVIVAAHPGDIPTGTLVSILRQAAITADRLRELL